MKIGYARVSTGDQNLEMQLAALKEAGCERVFADKATGTNRQRPKLAQMLKQLAHGDEIIVYRLDRLARSVRDLFALTEEIAESGASFRSLGEPWADTTSPAGRMILTVFAGLAEFERDLIASRTADGRIAALKRGVKFGRPKALTEAQKIEARRLREEGRAVKEIAELFSVSPATMYRLFQ